LRKQGIRKPSTESLQVIEASSHFVSTQVEPKLAHTVSTADIESRHKNIINQTVETLNPSPIRITLFVKDEESPNPPISKEKLIMLKNPQIKSQLPIGRVEGQSSLKGN
jgi:hypothetical protein